MMNKPKVNKNIVHSRRRSAFAHIFKILYIVGELAIVNLSVVTAFFLIYNPNRTSFKLSFSHYVATIPFLMIAAIVYIDYLGMTHFFRKTRTDMFYASCYFSFLVTLTASTVAFFFMWFSFPRYVLVLSAAILIVFSTLWSDLCLWISKKIYRRGRLLIIAADKADADRLFAKVFPELNELHLVYIGYTIFDGFQQAIAKIDQCTEVLVSSQVPDEEKSNLFLYCSANDKTAYVVPQFSDLVYSKFRVIQFSDMPTFMIDSIGLTFQQRLLKRAFDIVFAILVLIVTLPLQLAIALIIRVTSPGPVIYSQERITLSGGIYKVYKFRTMVHDAEKTFGAYQSSKDDPRVTPFGRFLRNRRIDELPQFLNILKGDMSVVGPRSDRPTTIGAFEDSIPGYSQRLKVKSGLTGLAQIYGKYDTDPEDKLRFDMMYIKNYSFIMDLIIIARTIRVMNPRNVYKSCENIENHEFILK